MGGWGVGGGEAQGAVGAGVAVGSVKGGEVREVERVETAERVVAVEGEAATEGAEGAVGRRARRYLFRTARDTHGNRSSTSGHPPTPRGTANDDARQQSSERG